MLRSVTRNLARNCSTKRGRLIRTKCSSALREPLQIPLKTSSSFGQPTPVTHPHILKAPEIVPGITLNEFQSRRKNLAAKILRESKNKYRNALLVLPSASKVYISEKIPYVFRQNSDFLYFSGCQEPDSILTLEINANEEMTSTLFVQPKEPHQELWDGPKTGPENAPSFFGVDRAFPYPRFVDFVSKEMQERVVYYDTENVCQRHLHEKVCSAALKSRVEIVNPKSMMHDSRLFKSPAEKALMRKSCEIAGNAIRRTIEEAKVGINEHEIFARVDFECRKNGAEFLAYPPVVAAGPNANIIHYIANNQVTRDGDLVLMDAGCEYHGYTSDITRTWPINGTFSDEQKVLYEIVLQVQKILIQELEQLPTLDQLFRQMCLLLGKRLKEVHLLPKEMTSESQIQAAAFAYCPHHVSHYLGMDVHDTGSISRDIPVRPGMVVTVEPGIYITPKNSYAPPQFHHLGIRIEDDVLLEENGLTVLSQNCPKEISDIEKLAKANQV